MLRGQGLHGRLETVLDADQFTAWTARLEDTWLAKPTLHPILINALIQEVRALLEACQESEAREQALERVKHWEQLHKDATVCFCEWWVLFIVLSLASCGRIAGISKSLCTDANPTMHVHVQVTCKPPCSQTPATAWKLCA